MKGWQQPVDKNDEKTRNPKAYLSRAKALSRLGLGLSEFRRLCILKGVFPRGGIKGSTTKSSKGVYYHGKDIRFLAQEPLLAELRQMRVDAKRIRKALGKHEVDRAVGIQRKTNLSVYDVSSLMPTAAPSIYNQEFAPRIPSAKIAHIIRERYPSLAHSLKDLDDSLSTIGLMAVLPVINEENVSGEVITECRELMNYWLAFTSHMRCLNKVFASIKGFYYEVTLFDIKVLWLVPHEFVHTGGTTDSKNGTLKNFAADVDLKVIAVFLDLHRAHLKFTLFKLFQLAGFAYPPTSALHDDDKNEGEDEDRRFMDFKLEQQGEAVQLPIPMVSTNDAASNKRRTLFSRQVFFVSRETPIVQLCYCLKACGAAMVGFEDLRDQSSSEIDKNDTRITHHIVDRPLTAMDALIKQGVPQNRSFVQPQWVFDSINVGELLPTHPYEPGQWPPPHLSPFVDDEQEGYVPAQRLQLEKWVGHKAPTSDDAPVITEAGLIDGRTELNHEQVVAIVEGHQQQIATTKGSHHAEEYSIAPSASDQERNTSTATTGSSLTTVIKLAEIKKHKEAKALASAEERSKVTLSSRKRRIYKQLKSAATKAAEKVERLKRKAAEAATR